MPNVLRRIPARKWRGAGSVVVAALLALQLASEALRALAVPPASGAGPFWLFYAAYALVAVLFSGVGTLVWVYGYRQQRAVSALLFIFCSLMTMTFGTLSAPAVGDALQVALGSVGSALAVLSLLFLLLRFPFDTLAASRANRFGHRALLVGLAGLTVLCLLSVTRSAVYNDLGIAVPAWWNLLGLLYYGFAGLACIGAVTYAARHAGAGRAQQQTRLFIGGTLLSFVPVLILTVLPSILHLHSAVDGTLSMLFLALFPVALGYSLLRYQILIFDTFILKTATRIVGLAGLALLGYALFAAGSTAVGVGVSFLLACLVAVGVVGAPVTWWAAARLTERYFFPEMRYYERMLKQVQQSDEPETFNLQIIAQLLVRDTMAALMAPEACLFFLDGEESPSFALVELYQDDTRQERLRDQLLAPLMSLLTQPVGAGHLSLAVDSPLAAHIQQAHRPLFLSEALQITDHQRGGLARYLSPRASHSNGLNPLLAPVHNLQGQLIGVLVVGERGDQEHYAGPELEALQRLVRSSSRALENARLYEVATRQMARSARELALAVEQQRKLNASKDELIIHMGHELRTPLTEVSGYLDLLGDAGESLDASLQTIFVQKAQHGCAELLQMVDTILQAAQTGAAVAPAACEIVSLPQVMRDELDTLERSANLEHCFQRLLESEVLAWANAQSVHQVVRNLLSNAIKYSPAQTRITVSATEDEDGPLLMVRDEGPGIPSDEMPLLFGKFVRLQRDISGAIRGTGLGLYICRQLVEAMGGQIWVESSGIAGQGSSFQVRLLAAPMSSHTAEDGAFDLAAV